MIPSWSILLLMLPTLMMSDVLTRVESGKDDVVNSSSTSSRRVAARFIGTPLRRQIRMIDKNSMMNEIEPPVRLRSPIKPIRNIYYYGDNQQLSRASGRFHNKMHAFPTHSIPQQPLQDEAVLPTPPVYDPKRHHRDKLRLDDELMAEAAEMSLGLERTTMRVRTFADIDVKKTTTTTTTTSAPVTVSVVKIAKKTHQPVTAVDRLASSPSSNLAPPAPPMRNIARQQQQLLLQLMQQSPPVGAALQQLQPVRVIPTVLPQLPPQIGPLIRHPAPLSPPLLHTPGGAITGPGGFPPGGVAPPPPPGVLTQPPVVNSQAPNPQLEQLGCGWDWVSNSCKEVFTIGWCGQCHDFGNVFVHNCKCVQPLINVKALV
ncbi:hypothetical protein PFISCL1PPCAC_2703, partial [Pristionchus fissidentatus]